MNHAAQPKRQSEGSGGSEGSEQNHHASATSVWEWVVAGIGLLLVLGTIGYTAYYGLTTEAKVPGVTVEPVGIERIAGAYVARFRARNGTSRTAAALQITGELRQGSAVIETSRATLDYLPPFSEREGGLIFQVDPAGYELRVLPKGYTEP